MGIRSGVQYTEQLRTSREIWMDGQAITDITNHPTFQAPIASIARLYDMEHDELWTDKLTYISEDTLQPTNISYLEPTTKKDLERRRNAIKIWADATFGMMGRSPDFLNSAIMAFASAKSFFADANPKYADNIVNFYRHCQENDLFLAHAVINPQIDRSKAPSQQENPYAYLRVIRETANGIFVKGAKMISTLAPIADELLVFPLPGLRPGDEPYTAAFCIPIGTPGLRLICRESFGHINSSAFDHPLASQYEEMDATCIFNDVFIPNERIFFYGDVKLANELYDYTTGRHHTGHQGIIRGLSKAELLTGLAIQLAETTRTNVFLHVQEMLGELLGYLELLKGAILLSESQAHMTNWGTICPAIEPIQAVRYHFPKMYKRMVEVIQILGAGSLLSTPTERDFQSPISSDIELYLLGNKVSAYDRVRLLKLAWDATGEAFGQRQLLYEYYHAGDPIRLAANQYLAYDTSKLKETVRRALANSDRK